MISIFICQIFCRYVISFNNRDTKDTQINTMVSTVSSQHTLQLEIITPYFIVLSYGTAYSIVYL